MIKYIVVDGELHGTGLRDFYEGGYIDPLILNLSDSISKRLLKWLQTYENEYYNQFINEQEVEKLDKEGIDIAHQISAELDGVKVHYYSAAKMKMVLI